MTSQQDTELDKILLDFRIASDSAVIGGDAQAYRDATQALTSWKDKEVIEAYEKGKYDGAREWAKVQAIENSSMHKSCVMPCCLSLQSQGGKNE